MRRYNDVTLLDGTVVDSGSEAWRLECEARAVLAMPRKSDRQSYLNGYTDIGGKNIKGVLQQRGAVALQELQNKIMQVWRTRQVAV